VRLVSREAPFGELSHTEDSNFIAFDNIKETKATKPLKAFKPFSDLKPKPIKTS
jgi:hypothetical protein